MTLKTIPTSLAILLSTTMLAQAGPDAMTPQEARHLLARTGFGAAPQEIASLTGKSYQDGISEIMSGITPVAVNPMPAWTNNWGYPGEFIWTMGQTVTDFYYTTRYQEIEELQQWWLSEMVSTPSPLTEKLTLFWHDHFATSFDAHENPTWMADQNKLLRANAAGNFADLASAILKDPAMLTFLTNTENSKDAPNENLAREFFELFTLGEGRGYTEDDIKEAARALTGHSVEGMGAPRYEFIEAEHDFGKKTIFGQRGRFDAPELVQLTLNNPDFGPYIIEKLWQTFISDQPDPAEIARLTVLWKAENYEMKPLLNALFLSDAFWADENRGRLIKSPVEMFVGTVRSLGMPFNRYADVTWTLGEMDQALFFPPNVAGWTGGTAWINDANAAARATALADLLGVGYDPDFTDAPRDAMMMTSTNSPTVQVDSFGPNDLRIGEVFISSADRWDNGAGYGMLVYLYDVSFAGKTWRSLPLWIESNDNGAEKFIAMHLVDCGDTCFPNWDRDTEDPGWIGVGLYDGARTDMPETSTNDQALLNAVFAHLPSYVARTKGRDVWNESYEPWENPDDYARHDEMIRLTSEFAKLGSEIYGDTAGALIFAPSPQGSLGLGLVTDYSTLSQDFDKMSDLQQQAAQQTAQAPYVFASAAEWLGALPFQGPQSLNAEAALLSVPFGGEAQRVEMIARDPQALLRRIILSPHFQVN